MEKDIIQLLLGGSITTIIGVAVILFCYRSFMYLFDRQLEDKKSELSKDVEHYKTKLELEQKDFMVEIERDRLRFQSEVDKQLAEHSVLFNSLNIERFRISNEVFGYLVNLMGMAKAYTSAVKIVPFGKTSDDFGKEQVEEFKNQYSDFWELYSPNRLYYSDSLSTKMFKLASEINNNVDEYTFKKSYNFDGFGDKAVVIQENFKSIIALEPHLKEIENELRKILGVD